MTSVHRDGLEFAYINHQSQTRRVLPEKLIWNTVEANCGNHGKYERS